MQKPKQTKRPTPMHFQLAGLLGASVLAYLLCCQLFWNVQDLITFSQHPIDLSLAWPPKLWLNTQAGKSAFCIALACIAFFWMTNSQNRAKRRGEEYGTARWGNLQRIRAALCAGLGTREKKEATKILSKNLCMSLDGYKHHRILNALVVGGSGAGKTRYFVKPNLLQCNSSFVILDPAGEILRDCGNILKDQGYVIQNLNIEDFNRSVSYNCMNYIKDAKDVDRLCELIIDATEPEAGHNSGIDPFWGKAERMYFTSMVSYVFEACNPQERSLANVLRVMEGVQIEGDESPSKARGGPKKTIVDYLFEDLRDERKAQGKTSIAWNNYMLYKNNSTGNIAKTMHTMVAARLRSFIQPEVQRLTNHNELQIEDLGRRKMAIFLTIPVTDKTFNFLISMFYLQVFDTLYRFGNTCPNNVLPVPVQIYMDEFANITVPKNFIEILSTCRKYGISCNIILQSLAQIKARYKDLWESIVGNCDTFLYLGGNDLESHKYILEKMGKETIYAEAWGKHFGRDRSANRNDNPIGRGLLEMNELQGLPDNYCLIFIRGYEPLIDEKFILEDHPKMAEDQPAAWRQDFDVEDYRRHLEEEKLFNEVQQRLASPLFPPSTGAA